MSGENVLTDLKWRIWLKLAAARRGWAASQRSRAWKCFLLLPNSVLAPSGASHSHRHTLAFAQGIAPSNNAPSPSGFSSPQTSDPTPRRFCSFVRCGELAAVLCLESQSRDASMQQTSYGQEQKHQNILNHAERMM